MGQGQLSIWFQDKLGFFLAMWINKTLGCHESAENWGLEKWLTALKVLLLESRDEVARGWRVRGALSADFVNVYSQVCALAAKA